MFRKFSVGLVAVVAAAAISLSVPPGAAFAATDVSYVAGAQQKISDSVVFANFGVGKPVLSDGAVESGAIMVAKNPAGDGVAIGWAVYPGLYGDSEPRLFVYWWKNNVGQCYNTTCAGFTPYSGATMAVGQKFTAGTPQRLGIQYSDGAWWFWAGTTTGVGSYIGYLTDSRWTAAWPAFSNVQLYGLLSTTSEDVSSQMGNGICAGAGASLAISSVSYTTSSTVNLVPYATAPMAYPVSLVSARSFRYGGSGSCG